MGQKEIKTAEGIVTDLEFLRIPSVRCSDPMESDRILSELRKVLDEVGDKGMGLAAIQLGYPLRVSVIKYGNKIHRFCNPAVSDASVGSDPLKEGCLSIPGRGFTIRRKRWVEVTDDINGTKRYEGRMAQAVQHELDHMDGVILCDVAMVDPELLKEKARVARAKASRSRNKASKKARKKNRK